MLQPDLRIGIDLGGTKIAAVALHKDNCLLAQKRLPTPQNDYGAILRAIKDLVLSIEQETGLTSHVGIGMPGSISPHTGTVQNANSVCLNGRTLNKDLKDLLNRPLRFENDANCFALSEATDGAGQGAQRVFGVIIGTGCGGGFVVDQQIMNGPRSIGGEWGHNPLPWPEENEYPGPQCWCGRFGCMETWVSGPAFASDHKLVTGQELTAEQIATLALQGDQDSLDSLKRYMSRLARGLSAVVNILDPDVIVLGGGLSQIQMLYGHVYLLMEPYIFSDDARVIIKPPQHGAESGVRGAAWLWSETEE